jgi:hypothetical protein
MNKRHALAVCVIAGVAVVGLGPAVAGATAHPPTDRASCAAIYGVNGQTTNVSGPAMPAIAKSKSDGCGPTG